MTSEFKGHLAMLCFSAFIAGSFALGSMISNNLSPLIVTVIRFMITALFLGGLIYFTQTIKKIYFISPWRYLFLGLCVTLYFVLMFEALKTSSAISLSVEFTMAPFISGLFGYFLLGQKINLRIFIALVIGAIGAIWVIFNGDVSRFLDFRIGRGELLFFIGMSFYALHVPLVRKLNYNEPPLIFTFGIIVAALFISFIFSFGEIMNANFKSITKYDLLIILYLAIFASAATFLLIQYAALKLPSVKVMAHTYLTPTWVIFWYIFMGKDGPLASDYIGISFTIIALFLLLKEQTGN
ncbi:MAG: DMT family transporter [Amylibacter sp.]|nr:DMT family transporter [Amylibacter sp.]